MKSSWDHDPVHYRPTGTSNSQVADMVKRMMARHMRHDHKMTMAEIQKELGISRKTLKIYLGLEA